MRVLITGSGGMLGSAIHPAFVRAGHDVVATDLVPRPVDELPMSLLDVRDYAAVTAAVTAHMPEAPALAGGVDPPMPDQTATGGSMTRRIDLVAVATALLLTAIVLVALVLHFAGLGWGRPFVYHADEWAVANPALDMVRTGSWIPNIFFYPSGLIYVERMIIAILHQVDPTVSLARTASDGYAGLPWRGGATALIEQFPYFYAGRAFVAIVGALMVLPTYLAARSASNVVGGIAAAVAIAVAPIVVVNSHYLTTDVPVAALASMTLWLSLRGVTGGRWWLVAAAFAAGLAASTKYNGGLVVVVPLVVLLTSSPPGQWLRRSALTTACLIVLASMVGFVLLTPAMVLDTAHVWTDGILWQAQGYAAGHPGAEGTDNVVYFLRVLSGASGLGPGLSALAGLGMLIAVVQHRRTDLAVLSFVIAYYVLICLPPVRFERNLLPLLPFLAVLSGRAVGWIIDLLADRLRNASLGRRQLTTYLRQASSVAVGLAIIAVAARPSFSAAVTRDQIFRAPDTRSIALDWIESHIPPGATIARENYTPQVPFPEYEVGFVGLLASKPLEWYRSAGFEYVVASSFQFERYRGRLPEDAFYQSLLDEPIVLDLRPRRGQPGPRVVVVALRSANPGVATTP